MISPLPSDERIACVFFPDFSLHRRNTGNDEQPVVLTHLSRNVSVLIAINETAARAGICIAMTLPQAQSYCASIQALPYDSEGDAQHLAQIASLFSTLTPRLEIDDTETGILYVSLQGISFLHKTETAFVEALRRKAAKTNLPYRIGIADNKLLARMAAQDAGDRSYLTVEHSTQSDFLSELPVQRLQAGAYMLDVLATLGIETIGELGQIPANQMAARFGDNGMQTALHARGIDRNRLMIRKEEEQYRIRASLDYGITDTEALLLDIRAPLTAALKQQADTGCGCRTLLVKFITENKQLILREVSLATVSTNIATFIRQLKQSLPAIGMDSGVVEWEIQLHNLQPIHGTQVDLITSASSSLADSVIPHRVRVASPTQGYLPDDLTALRDNDSSPDGTRAETAPCQFSRSTEGLRLLTQPERIIVRVKDGLLDSFSKEPRTYSIRKQFGPWVLSGGWWDRYYERWYFEAETTTHERYLLYFDAGDKLWYCHGVYD